MISKDLEKFKKQVREQRDIIGVRDWSIAVDMDELEEDRVAQCSADVQNRCVLITINKTIENPTKEQLEDAARHEVLEISVADIRELLCKFYSWDFVDGILHKHIRRMENALRHKVKQGK